MNQSVNTQTSEFRELSLDELDYVPGGKNMISFGPIRITVWKDGAVGVDVKGVGGVLFDQGLHLCPPQGSCTKL